MKKKLLFSIVAIILALATITVGVLLIVKNFADTKLSIGEAKGLAGDTVEIPVMLDDNPGLWAGQIVIDYDSDSLSFVSISSGEVFETCESNDTGESVSIVATNGINSKGELKNTKKDGTVATLKFKIKTGAEKGAHDITVNSVTNFCNAKEEMVDVVYENGVIKVK